MRARSRVREVLIIAGEASGDLHASGFAAALKRIRPDLTLTGVGGARMESGGVTLLERSDRMAVMGFVEVIRQDPRHYALLSSLKRRVGQAAPMAWETERGAWGNIPSEQIGRGGG